MSTRKTVGLGADMVLAPGSLDIHAVQNAYAEDISAWRGQCIPNAIDQRRLWESPTTICGMSGPWDYKIFKPTTRGNCDACQRGIPNAYQAVPDHLKIAAGWKQYGSTWRKPSSREN